jgi:hypothetical protein
MSNGQTIHSGRDTIKAERDVIQPKGDYVGRDKIGNIYVQQDDEFIEIRLDAYQDPNFPEPQDIQHFLKNLYSQKILILGGKSTVSKDDLARHLARSFCNAIQHRGDISDANGLPLVLQWKGRSDPGRTLLRIQRGEQEKPQIFLLTGVQSGDFRHNDLVRLQNYVDKSPRYVIISTEIPYHEWKLQNPSVWVDLTERSLFTPDKLARTLIAQIRAAEEFIPDGLEVEGLEPEKPLFANFVPVKLVARLSTLNRIHGFVSLLRGYEGPLTIDGFRHIIDQAVAIDTINPEEELHEWYRGRDARTQLLALSLALLSGLHEDQFFATLDHLYTRVYRQRDPSLKAFDYDDMGKLERVLDSVLTESGERIMQIRPPYHRSMLLAECWRNQRRKLIATLPVLVQLTKNSGDYQEWDREIHRTPQDREQFRAIASETLSEIGLLDQGANIIKDALANLAIDQHIEVQLVAASAMASWISDNREATLFQLLNEWQFDSRLQSLLEAIFAHQTEQESQTPQAYMRSTIALTVGYAARFYEDDQFASELLKLFDELTNDPNNLVLDRVSRYTLPQVTLYHLNQVKDSLTTIVKAKDGQDQDLYIWVAASLASAYQFKPADVSALINAWRAVCERDVSRPININKVTERERLMATIALFYGFVEYNERYFEELNRIINQEKHPFIRTNVVIAVTLQARNNLEKAAPWLQKFLSSVIEKERNDIIRNFRDIYLDQRAQQEGGDTALLVDKRRYPVWKKAHQRPLTPVEEVMIAWVKDPTYPVAQQVALMTLVVFAGAIEQPVDAYLKNLEKQEEQPETEKTPTEIALKTLSDFQRRLNPLTSLVVFVFSLQRNKQIRGLLPEAIAQKRVRREELFFVLDGWKNQTSDRELSAIGKKMRQMMPLIEYWWVFVLLIVGILFCCFPGFLSILEM